MTTLARAIPVWLTLDASQRLALLDLGTLFHRGAGAPLPVQVWNSPQHPEAPDMTQVELSARALDAYGAALLAEDALWVWQGAWHSLADPVELADIAANTALPMWLQLRLPIAAEAAPATGRLLIELQLTWN